MYFPGSLRASLAVLGLICLMHAQLLGLARANDPKSLESKLTKANYEKIKTGMTREQVEEILGPGKDMPASEYPQPRTRVQARIKQLLDSGVATALKWASGRRLIIVVFKDQKVTAQSSRNLPDK